MEIPGPGWPGPNSGTSFVRGEGWSWTGSFVPVYHFVGYAYPGETVIPLGLGPTGPYPFGGWVNCLSPVPERFDAVDFGGMGINTNGIYAEPPGPSPVENTTWGAMKAIYRE